MSTTHRPEQNKQTPANERRRGTRESITRMVEERTQVLTLYWRLAGLDSFAEGRSAEPVRQLLQEFCQLLIDYIAAGHFSLYERIVNGTERRRELADLAQELYPRIADTTTRALDFNDKYDGERFEITDSFKSDLSRLGEDLAVRIELEDKLLSRMIA